MGLLGIENTISGEDYSIQPDGYKTTIGKWRLVTGDYFIVSNL